MKAAVYVGNKDVKIKDIPEQELNDRKGALIETIGCGLCGSDIVKIQQELETPGSILGHEVVGIVKELNSTANTSISVGDKVALAHHYPCDNCRYCIQGSYSMCSEFKSSNLEPGGFTQYIYISEKHLANTTVKIPEGINTLQASFFEPLGCVLRALDKAQISDNSNILIVGLGFIGLLFAEVLKNRTYNVIGCDLLPARVEIAKSMGVDYALVSGDIESSVKNIRQNIDFDGVDVVILASGSKSSMNLALKSVRNGGKIIVFASIPDNNYGFTNNQIYYRELSVVGAYSSSPRFLKEAMNFISHGNITLDKFCDIMQIEDIRIAIDNTINNKAIKVFLTL